MVQINTPVQISLNNFWQSTKPIKYITPDERLIVEQKLKQEEVKCLECVGDIESVYQCRAITCPVFGRCDLLKKSLRTIPCFVVRPNRKVIDVKMDEAIITNSIPFSFNDSRNVEIKIQIIPYPESKHDDKPNFFNFNDKNIPKGSICVISRGDMQLKTQIIDWLKYVEFI